MATPHLAITPALKRQLALWLDEDIGRGDLSAACLGTKAVQAHWVAKADGVFAGGLLAAPLFRQLDDQVHVRQLVADGEPVRCGERLLELEGSAAALVGAERTALNLAMRLSGIATATAALVAQLEGSGVQLADTRKTTPGLRMLEKYAVRCGGGLNHRLGLDDAAMLKENHLAWAGGMEEAVAAVRAQAPWPSKLIIEAETAGEAAAAIKAGADGVLLDEFSPEELAELVPQLRQLAQQRGSTVMLEASGIQPQQLSRYGTTGIDLISTSAPVTRSPWLDLSMRFSGKEG